MNGYCVTCIHSITYLHVFILPGFYQGIFVWGGSSDEGRQTSGGLGVLPQKILNFRSPET